MVKIQHFAPVAALLLAVPVEAQISVGMRLAQMDDEFYQVRAATRLDDGTIFVGDASQEVRTFGRSFTRFGGEGQGPGEFQSLAAIGSYRGDSLITWDARLLRASVFSRDGELARTLRLDPPVGEGRIYLIGWNGDGSLVGYENIASRQLGTSRSSAVIFTTDAAGNNPRVLLDHGGRESTANQERQGNAAVRMDIILPWGQQTLFGFRDGRLAIVENQTGEVIVVADNDTLEFTANAEPIAWENAFLRGFARQLAYGMEDRIPVLERMLSAAPVPDRLPSFSRVEIGANGEIWLEYFRRPDDTQPVWAVYDGEANHISDVTMPDQFTVLEVGSDYVLGVRLGDLDIELVELYRLDRS